MWGGGEKNVPSLVSDLSKLPAQSSYPSSRLFPSFLQLKFPDATSSCAEWRDGFLNLLRTTTAAGKSHKYSPFGGGHFYLYILPPSPSRCVSQEDRTTYSVSGLRVFARATF